MPFSGFVDKTVLSIAGAILSATVARSLSSRASEIGSEALCWTILPVFFVIERRIHAGRYMVLPSHPPDSSKSQQNGSSIASWLAALAITLGSCFNAEFGANLLLVSNP
jgi:hypothetical protein